VFAGLALEEYGSSAFDVRDRAITKPHGPVHLVIDLYKGRSLTYHVVRGTRVKDPMRAIAMLPVPKLNEQLPFVEVNNRLLPRAHQLSDGPES
jgi:hypothetical protein